MKKSKKSSSEIGPDGRWIREKNTIKGAIRRTFRLSPIFKAALYDGRQELPPALKKDGTPGKKPQVRFNCEVCGELFSQKNIQIDHIEPVTPLHRTDDSMSYDELVLGIHCGRDNLQRICSTKLKDNGGKLSCHHKKTGEENFLRSKIAKAGLIGINPSNYPDKMVEWKREYENYLTAKELERLAKEERKKLREAKRAAKNAK